MEPALPRHQKVRVPRQPLSIIRRLRCPISKSRYTHRTAYSYAKVLKQKSCVKARKHKQKNHKQRKVDTTEHKNAAEKNGLSGVGASCASLCVARHTHHNRLDLPVKQYYHG